MIIFAIGQYLTIDVSTMDVGCYRQHWDVDKEWTENGGIPT